jgi:hypothetical protein
MNEFTKAYVLRCKEASKEQGIDQLVADLKEEDITATSEQTGGFTMCAYLQLSDNRYIYANAYGASVYDAEGYESDIIQLDEADSKQVATAVARYIKREAK